MRPKIEAFIEVRLTRDTFFANVSHRDTIEAGAEDFAMNRDVRVGRWLQLRGRMKLGWARLFNQRPMLADGHADVVAGALQESYGLARHQAVRDVTRGIDAVATVAKRFARTLAE